MTPETIGKLRYDAERRRIDADADGNPTDDVENFPLGTCIADCLAYTIESSPIYIHGLVCPKPYY